VNQAGRPLNIFDIVVAKTYRPPDEPADRGFYLREIFDEFRSSLKKSNYAEIDDLTLLQIVAVLVNRSFPEAGIYNITEKFLNELQAKHIGGIWMEARGAIARTFDFFENVLKIKGPNLIPYRYFYMTIAWYFFANKNPDWEFIQKYFWYYSFHNEDLLANTTNLREHLDIMDQHKETAKHAPKEFLVDRTRLREASYSSRGRLSRATIALLAACQPKDWAVPHRSVLSDVYYAITDRPNLHHIFPLAFVEKGGCGPDAMNANSLMNIAYLTNITNLKISDKNPLEYLRDYDVEGFSDVLSSHLVPLEILEWSRQEQMPGDALAIFIEKRVSLLIAELSRRLKDTPFRVVDSKGSATVVPA
jgi:hypothetical protein